jgi:carbamoyltransferase
MYILGIVEGHNCSAALLKDGELIAVCFEERLTRLKNDMGYPKLSIEYCLSEANISPDEIDYVAMATNNLPFGQVAVKREATFSVSDHIFEQENYWKPYLLEGKKLDFLDLFKDRLCVEELSYKLDDKKLERASFEEFKKIRLNTVKEQLNKTDEQIQFINHHKAHSMYAIFSSPKCYEDNFLVLVADGYGEDCSSSVGIWKDNKFDFIAKSPRSGIGRLYRYVTLLLGMRPGVDEYKVMGLSPYATEYHWRQVYDALGVYLKVNGLEIDYTNPDKDLYFSLKERMKSFRFDGIAGGLQAFVEDISQQWVKNAIKETGINKVVYSGGVAMNIKINKAIMELDEVEDIFVGPSGGDESLSIGAAYALWHELKPNDAIKPLTHTYLGPGYDKEMSKQAIEKILNKDDFEIIEDPTPKLFAEQLNKGFIMARAKGRMEYGARALGNRSIMAKADDPLVIRKINSRVKRRDFWMPFAPMVLAECVDDYIVNPKNIYSPYMTIGFDSTELAKEHLRAGLHPADDTMRPQIVYQNQNPELHDVLTIFKQKSGLGGVLNTSFNLHNEPVCCTPFDSLKTFINTELDGIEIEGYLILRKSK